MVFICYIIYKLFHNVLILLGQNFISCFLNLLEKCKLSGRCIEITQRAVIVIFFCIFWLYLLVILFLQTKLAIRWFPLILFLFNRWALHLTTFHRCGLWFFFVAGPVGNNAISFSSVFERKYVQRVGVWSSRGNDFARIGIVIKSFTHELLKLIYSLMNHIIIFLSINRMFLFNCFDLLKYLFFLGSIHIWHISRLDRRDASHEIWVAFSEWFVVEVVFLFLASCWCLCWFFELLFRNFVLVYAELIGGTCSKLV